MAIIEIRKVNKSYGSSRAITDLSLSIDSGQVVGFLGPNGAGKTTTISMLVDLIRPDDGTIEIFGLDAQRDGVAIRQRIGFLAGDFALNESLTGWQQLIYYGNLRGGVDKQKIAALASRLSCDLSRHIKTLSRGNRQKIGLISALMHEPELLIFDEPTSGLDPLIQAEFNRIIIEHKTAGKTAFISSHVLSEVQEVCDRVAFIRAGKLIVVQDIDELASKSPKQLRIVSDDPKLKVALADLAGLHLHQAAGPVYDCTYNGDIHALLKVLAAHKLHDVTITEADLEAIFMKYYGTS